jgi:hypothetical protein
MLRRLIVVTALTAGMSIAAAITLAAPALAKGPSQASITGPGLAHPVVVSGPGETQGRLGNLALETGLFTAMFGTQVVVAYQTPQPLRTPPPAASLGPRYTIVYTVPGVAPQHGEQYGTIRQYIYPLAPGGPATYTPPRQQGFGGSVLSVTGWLRATSRLTRTFTQLGIRPRAQAAPQAGSGTPAWLIALAATLAAAALAGGALWLRHRRPRRHLARDDAVQQE